jgi:MoaA/NifB/PqqE/SkfB family radical SAM enzyme
MCSWKKQALALPKNVFRSLVLRARIVGVRVINVTGGEPTLLPDIKDMLKYIKDNGLRVSLSTNGCVGPGRLKELIEFIDMVDISLDSYDAAIHDRIRGKAGAFKETMETISLLAASHIRPHINVTIRPDNYKGLHRMIPLLAGNIDSISFNLVDTGMLMDKAAKFIFSTKQLESFYFDESILILRACIKSKIKVRITPFFDEYRGRFRTMFLPHNNKCAIPKSYLRVNPGGDIASCCFQDDDESPRGNVIREDLCDIVVSDRFFNFINNAISGKGPCRMCKKSYTVNYGGNN